MPVSGWPIGFHCGFEEDGKRKRCAFHQPPHSYSTVGCSQGMAARPSVPAEYYQAGTLLLRLAVVSATHDIAARRLNHAQRIIRQNQLYGIPGSSVFKPFITSPGETPGQRTGARRASHDDGMPSRSAHQRNFS
jgi:hypothetical protein